MPRVLCRPSWLAVLWYTGFGLGDPHSIPATCFASTTISLTPFVNPTCRRPQPGSSICRCSMTNDALPSGAGRCMHAVPCSVWH